MHLLEKIKEIGVSVVPIMLVVLLLYPAVGPAGAGILAQCFVGGLLIIFGLALFLIGAEIGILPMGHLVGAALLQKRSVPLLLAGGFFIGFFVTIAEPDVHVLANQVAMVAPSIPRSLLLTMIALGVGFFVSVAMGRILFRISYRFLLAAFYLPLFIVASFTAPRYVGIAFDAGGATTGPMAVPFIMALGAGVAAVRGTKDAENNSFGVVDLASIGPIMAVLLMGLFDPGGAAERTARSAAESAGGLAAAFLDVLPHTFHEVLMALGPLAGMLIFFQITLLKMNRFQLALKVKGFLYGFTGLLIFLVGVKGGFIPAGALIGEILGASAMRWVLIPLGFTLGAIVVLAEPAVWILNDQIEEVSGGAVNRRFILTALSVGVSCAVGFSMIRLLTHTSIWWFLVPGYALALGLTFHSPPLFTAVAFDSGGVTSGPMSSTFLLAFTLGASAGAGGDPVLDAFGVVGMIAMVPLITIQVLGILFSYKERRAAREHATVTDEEGAS
jgi:hypothetical protein